MAFGRKETVRLPPLFGGSLAAIGMNQGSPPIQEPPLLAVGITLWRGIMRIHEFLSRSVSPVETHLEGRSRAARPPVKFKHGVVGRVQTCVLYVHAGGQAFLLVGLP